MTLPVSQRSNSAIANVAAQASTITRVGTELARYSLIVVLGLIGLSKFTPGEAAGIMPLVSHSPLVSWLYSVTSTQGVSDLFGTVELVIVILLLLRPVLPAAGAIGGLLATLTFLTTLSFLLSTPGAFAFNGLALLGDAGAFLIKDLALLSASLIVLGQSLASIQRGG
jgi:uncharacterized membrane protein YkgB